MEARDGPQIELEQNEFLKMAPSLASLSICGVGATSFNGPPYAEMAFKAWSSEKMNKMLGRLAASAEIRERAPSKVAIVRRFILYFLVLKLFKDWTAPIDYTRTDSR
jgi:hypothetical protein